MVLELEVNVIGKSMEKNLENFFKIQNNLVQFKIKFEISSKITQK